MTLKSLANGLQVSHWNWFSAFGNTVPDDLWGALQAQADEDDVEIPLSVKAIMDTWTDKMGYPVVTVTRNYQTGHAEVFQVN